MRAAAWSNEPGDPEDPGIWVRPGLQPERLELPETFSSPLTSELSEAVASELSSDALSAALVPIGIDAPPAPLRASVQLEESGIFPPDPPTDLHDPGQGEEAHAETERDDRAPPIGEGSLAAALAELSDDLGDALDQDTEETEIFRGRLDPALMSPGPPPPLEEAPPSPTPSTPPPAPPRSSPQGLGAAPRLPVAGASSSSDDLEIPPPPGPWAQVQAMPSILSASSAELSSVELSAGMFQSFEVPPPEHPPPHADGSGARPHAEGPHGLDPSPAPPRPSRPAAFPDLGTADSLLDPEEPQPPPTDRGDGPVGMPFVSPRAPTGEDPLHEPSRISPLKLRGPEQGDPWVRWNRSADDLQLDVSSDDLALQAPHAEPPPGPARPVVSPPPEPPAATQILSPPPAASRDGRVPLWLTLVLQTSAFGVGFTVAFVFGVLACLAALIAFVQLVLM